MIATRHKRARVVVTGILFWYPLAGVTFQFLHYLVGLRRLGYDVYYAEDPSQWIYDPILHDLSPDATRNVEIVAPILAKHGFEGRWAFRGNYAGGRAYGMPEAQVRQLYRDADALLNVTGQELREEHLACGLRIYVESDPFSFQVKVAQGDDKTIAHLAAHHVHFTFGENLGAPDCLVPTGRFSWLPTRQPIVLDLWEAAPAVREAAYTTVATWKNPDWKEIEYQGVRYYWSKGRELEKILDLPRKRPVPFEIALRVDDGVEALLRENGWRVVSSLDISQDLDCYRSYILNSRGEFSVAKDQYVRPRTGWFSDRSACYLAAGRPVITQETGFSKILPTGKGLHAWSTMEGICTAIDAIESDYQGQCRAAREVAAEYFAAEKVLDSLMQRAGL